MYEQSMCIDNTISVSSTSVNQCCSKDFKLKIKECYNIGKL